MEERFGFLCGVVEGFYGRPWSMEQRKVLFKWLQRWGLNTYLYGPKDDLKHRMLWREMYSEEEAVHLKALIQAAHACGLQFIYALSPGQDIIFSNSYDVVLLKRKLRQVAGLGCKAFAILFDDIAHTLCQVDKDVFSSFAHAQVSVANEIFQYLEEPCTFLFCPTEYCNSLCYPSLAKSAYLKTIGEELLPGIGVIWTGTKVISKELTEESIKEVQEVLQRRPLIWDNLHANDYDSKIVFLGPFKGRPIRLGPHLQGLLLNPNCEFEANFIPVHTLGSWFRSIHRMRKYSARSDGSATKEESGAYCPEDALCRALQDWTEEIGKSVLPGRQTLPVEDKSSTNSEPKMSEKQGSHITTRWSHCKSAIDGPEEDCEIPKGPQPYHSSEGRPSVPCQSKGAPDIIPNETATVWKPCEIGENREQETQVLTQLDSASHELEASHETPGLDDLHLLVRLFYLPYEHGDKAQHLLKEFQWLKANSSCVSIAVKKGDPQKVDEWRSRALHFKQECDNLLHLHSRIIKSTNQAFLYDIYPYVWDVRNTTLLAKAFVLWLDGHVLSDNHPFGSWRNCFHWCRTIASVDLLGVEVEPWVFKGGISGEFQMMLPLGTSPELFTHPPPLFPASQSYNIRPFASKDKAELYRICRELHHKSLDPSHSLRKHPDLTGDSTAGPLLHLSPEYSFILEDDRGLCGYALGVMDVKSFVKNCETTWFPAMREKYPQGSYTEKATYPDSLLYHFPSLVHVEVLPDVLDSSVARCLATCLLLALKVNGSQGVFCEMLPTDQLHLEFFTKLGFLEIFRSDTVHHEDIVLGRLL
ncbi:protein O-GlcNAcase isoform X1 [Polypterus senegalus]|uniref:protein O-GlcNAcase isoform X1 n=1 Tax=Polypterus senegalus TaxID=55291 RepID=UPI001966A437|nr:protein O-GlcNAcase isoform X1 [Polypterus senegalus]